MEYGLSCYVIVTLGLAVLQRLDQETVCWDSQVESSQLHVSYLSQDCVNYRRCSYKASYSEFRISRCCSSSAVFSSMQIDQLQQFMTTVFYKQLNLAEKKLLEG